MRWIVDGMNVIGSRPDGWWRDRHSAMVRLVDALERWAADSGEDVTVVFEQPPNPPIRSSVIHVAHAKRARANSADDEIMRRLVAAGDAHDVRVVTSDGWLADQVRAAGASVEPAQAFRNALDPAA
jgi:predicted RNA-binding protein with PIN domain